MSAKSWSRGRNCIPLMHFVILVCILSFIFPLPHHWGTTSESWVLLEKKRFLQLYPHLFFLPWKMSTLSTSSMRESTAFTARHAVSHWQGGELQSSSLSSSSKPTFIPFQWHAGLSLRKTGLMQILPYTWVSAQVSTDSFFPPTTVVSGGGAGSPSPLGPQTLLWSYLVTFRCTGGQKSSWTPSHRALRYFCSCMSV